MYFFTPNTSHDLTCVSVLECINNNQPGIESLSSYTPRHLSTLCVSKMQTFLFSKGFPFAPYLNPTLGNLME